jgi:transposase
MIRNKPRGATVYGIDLGKNIFHVVGTDSAGNVVQRVKFRRDTLRAFFERAERALVGMEACPGSQWPQESCRRWDTRSGSFRLNL